MPRISSRLTTSVLACATVLLGVTVVTAAPASAACAARTSNRTWGTVSGQDHRDINAQVSFDIVDRYDHEIGLDGCRVSGYSKTIWMNMNLSGEGAAHTVHTANKWEIDNLPANAVSVWIEVYTRTNTGRTCGTCDGVIDTHRYGWINRRAVHLNHGVTLVAPLNCGLGGTSGSIQGALWSGGKKVRFDRIYAWSELTPDGSKPLQGWGQGLQPDVGYYKIPNLASGQSYVLQATYHGVTKVFKHIPIHDCKTVPLAMSA